MPSTKVSDISELKLVLEANTEVTKEHTQSNTQVENALSLLNENIVKLNGTFDRQTEAIEKCVESGTEKVKSSIKVNILKLASVLAVIGAGVTYLIYVVSNKP